MRLVSSRFRTPLLVAALAATAFGGWFTQLPRATAAPPAQTCAAANLPAGFVSLPVRTLTRLPPTIARTATGGIRLDPAHWVAAQIQDANIVAVWNRADPYLPPKFYLACGCITGTHGSCGTIIQGNDILCSENGSCKCEQSIEAFLDDLDDIGIEGPRG